MSNRKGFTLIELLAVIVILAIIMVIAVPQILNVIDSSRTSAWSDSTKLLKDAIVTNTTLYSPTDGSQKYTIIGLCSNPSKLNEIADLGDMNDVTCTPNDESNKYTFYLEGKNQFDGKSATIKCTKEGSCTSSVSSQEILYNRGDKCTSVTGGWNIGKGQSNGTYEDLSDSVHLSATSIFYCESYMTTVNTIDLSDYSKIKIEYKFNSISNYDYGCLNYDIGTLSGRSPHISVGDYT